MSPLFFPAGDRRLSPFAAWPFPRDRHDPAHCVKAHAFRGTGADCAALRWLPGELRHHGVTTLTASEALERFGDRAHDLELPVPPTTWAGKGDMSFFRARRGI